MIQFDVCVLMAGVENLLKLNDMTSNAAKTGCCDAVVVVVVAMVRQKETRDAKKRD